VVLRVLEVFSVEGLCVVGLSRVCPVVVVWWWRVENRPVLWECV